MGLAKYKEQLLSLIYPKICFGCKRSLDPLSHIYLCPDCWNELDDQIIPPFCITCGKPIDISDLGLSDVAEAKSGLSDVAETKSHKCPACTSYHFYFTRGYTTALYEGLVKDSIHNIKYNYNTYLAGTLAQLMIDFSLRYMDLKEIDKLVPVPLHWRRLRERGFNQTELLTRKISTNLGIPVGGKGLCRIRHVPPQTGLPQEMRLNNVRGVFRVTRQEEFMGKRILLIDDVFTTGATLNECSRVIMEAGAKEVWVFSLARVI